MSLSSIATRFRPGQSGNPSGKPKLPPELAAITSLTRIEAVKIISKYLRMKPDEAIAATQDPNTPIIDKMILKICAEGLAKGDEKKLGFLLEKALGRDPVSTEVTESTEDKELREKLSALSDDELVQLFLKTPEEKPNV